MRRCLASFSAEGTTTVPRSKGRSKVLGFGTGNGPWFGATEPSSFSSG